VYVTDMDQIEKSNLSRQFLFRNTDISRPKSATAVRAVTAINPAFHTVAYESKVRVVCVGCAGSCNVQK
jgi:ubiquitin-activating enzyme E1